MKDAKGHGSNLRGGFSVDPRTGPTPEQMSEAAHRMYGGAAHQWGVGRVLARPTGFPVGGFYAVHPETGEALRHSKAKYGDLPPRFATPEKAHAFALKAMRRRK